MNVGFSIVLRVAALVIFIVAAIFGIADKADFSTLFWMTDAGLAAWVGSTIVP